MIEDQRGEVQDRRLPHEVHILHHPRLNKGTAFTERERDSLGLRGLLPHRVFTQEEHEYRALANLCRLASPLDKYPPPAARPLASFRPTPRQHRPTAAQGGC